MAAYRDRSLENSAHVGGSHSTDIQSAHQQQRNYVCAHGWQTRAARTHISLRPSEIVTGMESHQTHNHVVFDFSLFCPSTGDTDCNFIPARGVARGTLRNSAIYSFQWFSRGGATRQCRSNGGGGIEKRRPLFFVWDQSFRTQPMTSPLLKHDKQFPHRNNSDAFPEYKIHGHWVNCMSRPTLHDQQTKS